MQIRIAALAFLLATSAAAAADLPAVKSEDPAALAATPFSWTGFYAGAQFGYGWSSSQERLYEPWRAPQGWAYWANSQLDPKGWLGGAYAGYNYAFENGLVLGAEGDFAFTNMKNKSPLFVYGPFNVYSPGDYDRSKIDWTGAVRGRVGYAFGRFLPYLAGGVAFAKFDDRIHHLYVKTSYGTTATGWTIGAGLEYALLDNLTLRAEYRYSDFGKIGRKNTATIPQNRYNQNVQYDLSIQDVRLGVAYKF
jgi:outer membrane immunogenic protein